MSYPFYRMYKGKSFGNSSDVNRAIFQQLRVTYPTMGNIVVMVLIRRENDLRPVPKYTHYIIYSPFYERNMVEQTLEELFWSIHHETHYRHHVIHEVQIYELV